MQLLRRRLNTNKGDFGHIFILAGSARYSGAASLCSLAAIRTGAGLVTLGIPESINNAMIKIKPREVMTLPLAETSDGSLTLSSYSKIKDFIKKTDIEAEKKLREKPETTTTTSSDSEKPKKKKSSEEKKEKKSKSEKKKKSTKESSSSVSSSSEKTSSPELDTLIE